MAGQAPASLPHLGLVFNAPYTLTAEQGAYSITGQDAGVGATRLLTSAQGSYSITGQDAGLNAGYTLACAQGSYSVTGQDASPEVGYAVTAAQGSYTITGQDAALDYAGAADLWGPGPLPHIGSVLGGADTFTLTAEQGSYSVTGQDATSSRNYVLAANFGAYALAGKAGILSASAASAGDPAPLPHLGLLLGPASTRTLTADAGIYSITGSDALADFELDSDQGTYTLTGQDAALRKTTIMSCAAGSYAISGQDATFVIGSTARVMSADYGAYAITGSNATLTPAFKISAGQGFYALLGQAASLVYSPPAEFVLTAAAGSYTVTGIAASLETNHLYAEYGVYSITGSDTGERRRQQDAGRSRRRKKTEVEIDGQIFHVETKEDATRLLEEARSEAERIAALTIERASKAERRPTRKVLADARKALQVPVIDADEDLQSEVEALQQEIADIYIQALQTVEIAALMRKAEIEEDDEDVLLLLS
jgi:hypothetical protein